MNTVPAATYHIAPSAVEADAAPIHDCWNVIGVEGNGTCRELARHTHCRNCAVYSAAGMRLLDRPLPAGYRRELAAHYAQAKQVTQPTRLSVVIFRLASEWLALPTNAFQEVAERRVVHTLPHRRRGLTLGLVNVRGELLVCASVARLLGMEEVRNAETASAEYRPPNSAHRTTSALRPAPSVFERLLVASWQGQRVAFPVTEVHGIHRFEKGELQAPPATLTKSALSYTEGVLNWRDRTVGLLAAETFFSTLNRAL